MTSSQSKGTLYTFPGNARAYKAQIAAQYSGAQLTIANEEQFKMNETNRSSEFVEKFPTGKVPAYENDAGVYLFEANAIAYFLSNDQLRGQTPVEQSQVFQWIEYSDREIAPVSQTLVYPCMGILQFNKNQNEHAKSELKKILNLLDQYLSTRTYLVGERVTLADVTVACDLFLLFQWIIDFTMREEHKHVTRWFLTLMNQKEFQAVLGTDFKLCERTAQFDAKKYAELSKKDNVPQTQPAPKNLSQASGEQKKEKKSAKAEKKPEKPAPAAKEEEEGEEPEDEFANEPKQKDPFADMPKPSFNMDEFKRVYSNEDTASKAIPYFWKNFDNEHCSIWFCEYKYPEDLSQVFMTCNLISGFFQRLDKLRKHAFASMCVFGENNNNTIAGIWIWRGHELAFELSSDWKVDYESYSWKRLSIDDETTKNLINQYLLWEVEFNGKKFNQGKIFK